MPTPTEAAVWAAVPLTAAASTVVLDKAMTLITDNIRANQRLECVTRHSHADVRLRLILLQSKRLQTQHATIEDFVKTDGSLVSKADMCRKIKTLVTSMRARRAELDRRLRDLDQSIENVTKTRRRTSSRVRSMAADARQVYNMLPSKPETESQASMRGSRSYVTKQLHELQEDTLLLQLETVQLYMKNQKEKAVQTDRSGWTKTTYDKNLDMVCEQFQRKRGAMNAFRKMLMDQPQRYLSGKHLRLEHLFRPDGTARPTPTEVCKAIRYYGGRRFWGLLGD